MTKEEFAKMLDGREYREEITEQEERLAHKNGLVIVFGYSDDLIEFRGAINDEADAYNGAVITIDIKGILPKWEHVCDDEKRAEDYFARKKNITKQIHALWCKEPGYSFTFKTDIPHATFNIIELGELYCRGIVFSIEDLK